MNVKQLIAAALLIVPVAAAALSANPASANEGLTRRFETERAEFRHRPRHEFFRQRRFFVPGHWEFNRFGHRYWVSGHYEYR